MTSLVSGKMSAKINLLKRLLSLFFPYVFQLIRVKDGSVLKKFDYTRVSPLSVAPGYYVEVLVDGYRDIQTLYSSDYTPRRGLVRVSRKLYENLYPGSSLKVFCQFHRVRGDVAKMWIALWALNVDK